MLAFNLSRPIEWQRRLIKSFRAAAWASSSCAKMFASPPLGGSVRPLGKETIFVQHLWRIGKHSRDRW